MTIKRPGNSTAETNYLQRVGNDSLPSNLKTAVVGITYGVSVTVLVDNCTTIVPWGMVESYGWESPTA